MWSEALDELWEQICPSLHGVRVLIALEPQVQGDKTSIISSVDGRITSLWHFFASLAREAGNLISC